MTYQVLARKWRPGSFNDMVGQTHVLKPLTHALDTQRLHHAYLFTGTRGVGKTTLARILSKCLNCEQGITSQPCGECSSCVEIAEGRFIDLIEVDAASRTKVEDTRELLENVQYAPSRGRYKIYLIDEVHMLSNHSFNALLKTLEEPPPHIMFLFATTDPQKLPITILSRCLQFNLKNLSPQLIENYLQSILDQEKINYEESALWQIATSATGSMRDALTLVDQAISFCEGEVLAEGVTDMLGTPDQGVIYNLLESLCNQDASVLLLTIQEVAEHAPDFIQLMESMLATFHRIAIAQVAPDAADNSFGDQLQIKQYAERFSPEDLQLNYQICLKGKSDLALSTDQRAMFEMLMIRMLVFSPNGVPAIPQVNTDKPQSKKQESSKADNNSQTKEEANQAAPKKEKKKKLSPDPPTSSQSSQDEVKISAPELNEAPPIGMTETEVSDSSTAQENRIELSLLNVDTWIDVYPQLEVIGITGNILANCIFDSFSHGSLKLVLDKGQSALYNSDQRQRIEELLRAYFQTDLAVAIDIGELKTESPAALSQRLKQQEIEDMQQQFAQDDNVKKLVDTFAGEIVIDTISPIQQ